MAFLYITNMHLNIHDKLPKQHVRNLTIWL